MRTLTEFRQAQKAKPLVAIFLPDDTSDIYNWEQWLELFEKAKTVKEKEGLLHCGFDVDYGAVERWEDRLIFYLSLSKDMVLGSDHLKFRRKVGEKAFHVLCSKVFPKEYFETSPTSRRNEQWSLFFREEAWLAILDSLMERDGIRWLCNISRSPSDREAIRGFMKNFLRLSWCPESAESARRFIDLSTIKELKAANQRQLLEAIIKTGNINIIEEDASEETLRFLEVLIFDQDFNEPIKAPVSLGEAMFGGHYTGVVWAAARALLLLKAKRDYQVKQDQIAEAEEQKAEAEAKLAQLKP